MSLIAGDAMIHLFIALAFAVTLIVPACLATTGLSKKRTAA